MYFKKQLYKKQNLGKKYAIKCLIFRNFSHLYFSLAGKVMVDNLALGDGQEGIKAFIEKRKPVWSHDKTTVH